MRRIGGILFALILLAGCRYETATETPAASPPPSPSNLTVTAVTASSVSLAWSAVDGATGYQVIRNGVKALALADPCCTDSGLSPATAYQYSVQAESDAGSSAPYTPPLTVTTANQPWAPLPGHIYFVDGAGAVERDYSAADLGYSYSDLWSLLSTYNLVWYNQQHPDDPCSLMGGGPA